MKKVYIILTHTGTILSRIIRMFTGNEFSHVSLALDMDLKKMYSFGRLNPYNPFMGGFVHEYITKGTFGRFKNTRTKIYALEITDEQYEKIRNRIIDVKKHRRDYKFNVIGLFAVGLHVRIQGQNTFYCAEFIKHLLEEADINTELPILIKPEDFKKIDNLELVYKGYLREYKSECSNIELLKKGIMIAGRKQSIV